MSASVTVEEMYAGKQVQKKVRAKTERGGDGVGRTRRVAAGTPATAAGVVRASILSSAPTPPDVCAMLDEIARLRKALGVFHADACAVMRSGSECTCGSSAAAAIVRATKLEAHLVLADAMVNHQTREILRLDLALVEAMRKR